MARVHTNFVRGVLTDAIDASETGLTSAGLALLAAVSGGDTATIVINPEGDPSNALTAPEIVYVTAHTSSATTATVARGQEGTTARAHAAGTPWVHGASKEDFSAGVEGTRVLSTGEAAGLVLTSDGADGASWESIEVPLVLQVGGSALWGIPGWFINSLGGGTVTQNRLYYTPFYVDKETTFDRIGLNVSSATSGNARLGVYAVDPDTNLPGDLILDAGTVDTSTTGVKEITINLTLQQGFYYLAGVSNGTSLELSSPNVGQGAWAPVAARGGAADDNFNRIVSFKNSAYAAFPSTAPTPDGGESPAPGAFVFLRRVA